MYARNAMVVCTLKINHSHFVRGAATKLITRLNVICKNLKGFMFNIVKDHSDSDILCQSA